MDPTGWLDTFGVQSRLAFIVTRERPRLKDRVRPRGMGSGSGRAATAAGQSVRAFAEEHDPHGLDEDQQVEEEGVILDVVQVELQLLAPSSTEAP